MTGPTPRQAGFLLAALLADDRELRRVRGGMLPERLREIEALLAEVLRERDRGARIASLLARVRPKLDGGTPLPPRLAALLAARMPRDAGHAIVRDMPTPRPGFAPSAALLPRLLRIARRAHACEAP